MALLPGTIATLFLLSPIISAAYIGLHSNENRQITDDEIDRSLVPMIRIPRDNNPFLRGSFESKANDADETTSLLKTTPTVVLDSSNFNKQTHDEGVAKSNKSGKNQQQKSLESTKQKHQSNKISSKTSKAEESHKTSISAAKSKKASESKDRKTGSDVRKDKKPENWIADQEDDEVNTGKCNIDGNNINNNENIYENDCGKLRCLDGTVMWSLKPLSKDLPRCSGFSSIPSTYTSYARIKVQDDEKHGITENPVSIPTNPIINQFHSTGKKTGNGIVDPKNWD